MTIPLAWALKADFFRLLEAFVYSDPAALVLKEEGWALRRNLACAAKAGLHLALDSASKCWDDKRVPSGLALHILKCTA